MAVTERSYAAANGLFSFLGVVAWISIVIGAISLLVGLANGGQMALVFAPLGLMVMIFGVIGLALVQIGRANVHSAEINWEMLVLARKADRLQSQPQVASYSRPNPESSASHSTNSPSPAGDRLHGHEENLDVAGSLWTKQLRDKEGNILKAFIYAGGSVTVEKDGTMHSFPSFLAAREFFNPEQPPL